MTLRYFGPHNTSKIDVYRPTEVRDPAGAVTWTFELMYEDMSVVLQHLTGGQATRLFGEDTKAKYRALSEEDDDIQVDDVIVVQTGPDEGEIIEVDSVIRSWNRMKNIVLRDTDKDPTA